VDFWLFLLVNAMLYIRPAEFAPALLGLPIYEGTIVACLVAAFPSVLSQLRLAVLGAEPINTCVVAMLPAILLSHLSHGQLAEAWTTGFEFVKVILYYMLLVGVVNSAIRLRRLLLALAGFAVPITALALLQYHQIVDLPAFEFVQTDVSEAGGDEH
jgi:putative inorganic carbon (HCO3(-)) transporter